MAVTLILGAIAIALITVIKIDKILSAGFISPADIM